MNKVIIVYGEMGMGKNYVGERIAKHLNLQFVDGDSLLPPSMLEKVKKFKPFTTAEIDGFVNDHLLPFVLKEAKVGLVIAQALYRQEHRNHITKQLVQAGIEVEFVLVAANSLFTHLERLWSRPSGLLWMLYGLINKPFFQAGEPEVAIDNSGNEDSLNNQIENLFW